MKTMREELNHSTQDVLDDIVERLENLLQYGDEEKYPARRVYEEIVTLINDIG